MELYGWGADPYLESIEQIEVEIAPLWTRARPHCKLASSATRGVAISRRDRFRGVLSVDKSRHEEVLAAFRCLAHDLRHCWSRETAGRAAAGPRSGSLLGAPSEGEKPASGGRRPKARRVRWLIGRWPRGGSDTRPIHPARAALALSRGRRLRRAAPRARACPSCHVGRTEGAHTPPSPPPFDPQQPATSPHRTSRSDAPCDA